jgi:hypothetical protein
LNFWDFLAALLWPSVLLFLYLDQRHNLPLLAQWLKGRAIKAGGMGMTVELQAEQRNSERNPVASEKGGEPPPAQHMLVQARSKVAENIAGSLLEQTKHLSPEDRASTLANAFANSRVLEAFEFVLNRIYGSQIEALRLLRDIPEASMLEANEFYQRVVDKYPEFYRAYGFNRWAGWLESQSLIERRTNGFAITPFGRDFLAYLAEAGIDVRRPN